MIPKKNLKSQQTPVTNLNKYLIGIQCVDDKNADNTNILLTTLTSLPTSTEKFDIINKNYSKTIKDVIDKIGTSQLKRENCFEKTKWISCPATNINEIKSLIDLEINSTIYNLRILLGSFLHCPSVEDKVINKYEEFPRCTFDEVSLLDTTKYKIHSDQKSTYFKPYIKFKINDANIKSLNGLWNNDKQYIKLYRDHGQSASNGRLVMAFGPSAAGKSTIGANFIRALSGMPQSYMTVDGGEYRRLSVMYQTIVHFLSEKKLRFQICMETYLTRAH
jgi:hypothetical protein